MNDPYPSDAMLHEEALVEEILAAQAADVAKFNAARDAFAKVFDSLTFPLGSPVAGYDIADINGTIADWMIGRDDYEQEAIDMARDSV